MLHFFFLPFFFVKVSESVFITHVAYVVDAFEQLYFTIVCFSFNAYNTGVHCGLQVRTTER